MGDLEEDPRYKAMSPREQATMRSLLGSGSGSRRTYNPHHRGWYKIDGDLFAAMREYYTGERTPPPPPPPKPETVNVGDITPKKPAKKMLALPAGPKLLAITEKASC